MAAPSKPSLSNRDATLRVIQLLHEAGFQALLAGGCVRDMLLGQAPQDYDVATNAVPEQVIKLFHRTLKVGAQFGVVIVLLGGQQIEVATFRSDGNYADGRRPDRVVFTDAREDALRRDFTINGMFFDPIEEKVIDYVGGQADLEKRIIRAIGDPAQRFAEDHLRMLRAVRFAARLDFAIEPATFAAIAAQAPAIERISVERVHMELEKILLHRQRVQGIELALQTDLLPLILAPLDVEALRQGQAVLGHLPEQISLALGLAGLLSAADAEAAQQQCRRLKSSNDIIARVKFLVSGLTDLPGSLPLTKGHLKLWLAKPGFDELLLLWRAVCRAQSRSEQPIDDLQQQIVDLGDEPISPPPLLDGHELMELGAQPGPDLGRLTQELYLGQLENEIQHAEQAKAWVRRWLEKLAGG